MNSFQIYTQKTRANQIQIEPATFVPETSSLLRKIPIKNIIVGVMY